MPAEPARRGRAGAALLRVGLELLPFLIFIAVGVMLVGRLDGSRWEQYFLYNGDSVLLPLIQQSIAAGEPFRWVFSSQLFIFPEWPLYVVSALVGGSIRGALLVNAVLNLVLLYGLFRLIARWSGNRPSGPLTQILCAVGAAAVYVVLVLLEPNPAINGTTVATLYLITTYYYGTVVVLLALIAVQLWFSRRFDSPVRLSWRYAVFAVLVVALAGLAATSNPLLLLQFVAPFVVLVVVLAFVNRMRWGSAALIAAPYLLAVVVSLVGRKLLQSFVSADIGRYLVFDQIPASIRLLKGTVIGYLSFTRGTIELAIIVAAVLFSLVMFIRALYFVSRPERADRARTLDLVVYGFVTISSAALVVGFIATGANTTRYFLPLYIVPLVGLMKGALDLVGVLAGRRFAWWPRARVVGGVGLAVIAAMAVVFASTVSVRSAERVASGDDYTYEDCLDAFTAQTGASGVGSFWTTRQLQLYGDHKGEILQVGPDFTVFPWMINLESYEGVDFSFVVVNDDPSREAARQTLGEPGRIVSCSMYDIYDYADTPGHAKLNSIVQQSLETDLAERGWSADR